MTAKDQLDPAVQVVAAYLTKRIGLSFTGSRREHLLGQIGDAMARAGTASGEWYSDLLTKDHDEFDGLVARLTVGESYFFREPTQIEVLRSTILPERSTARGPGTALRLWSAGCASGQEAYTMAILLEEEGLDAGASIVATDISRDALRVAAAGIYGSWSLRAVTARQREEYFHPLAMGYRVDERFVRSVTFRPLNLVEPGHGAPREVDVILCRNVLIYFAPEAMERAARCLAGALAPGGWLITGSSDPPLPGIAELEATLTTAGLVYRRTTATTRHAQAARPVDGVAVGARRRPAQAPVVVTPAPDTVVGRPARPAASRSAGPALAKVTHDDSADEAVRSIRGLGGVGDLPGALDAAAAAITRFPLNAEIRFLQAVVLLEAGRPSDAAASARAALYLEPGLAMAHLALARAETALGNREAARRSLRNAAVLLSELPGDAPVPMSDGEPAGRLAAMAIAHDRVLVGSPRSGDGQ